MRGRQAGLDLSGTDGAIEVLSVEGDDVTIGIVNPDGSRAEMSGNGTRIAAAWLMARTGSTAVRVHVGPRTVAVRRTEDGLYESELGAVEVGPPELVDGIELTPVTVGNPHAVVAGDPEPDRGARPTARDTSALPGADERAGRPRGRAGGGHRTRMGARGGGDERIREQRGRGRGRDARRRGGARPLPRRRPARPPGRGSAWLTGPAEPLDELPGSGHETGTGA